jgi:hypothetical protein
MQSDVHGPWSGQAAAQTARMSNDARFPPDTYGMLSRHGMRPGMDGPVNKINQDRAALCQHPHDSSVVVAAVFDGHGHNGGEASHFVMDVVLKVLLCRELGEDPGAVLRVAVLQAEARQRRQPPPHHAWLLPLRPFGLAPLRPPLAPCR